MSLAESTNRMLKTAGHDAMRLLDPAAFKPEHDRRVWDEIGCAMRWLRDTEVVQTVHAESIGTYSPEMGTFRWSWAARSVKAPTKQQIDAAFREGHRLELPDLTIETVELDDEDDARKLAALAAHLAKASGVVAVEDGTRTAFIALFESVVPGATTDHSISARLPPYSVPPPGHALAPPASGSAAVAAEPAPNAGDKTKSAPPVDSRDSEPRDTFAAPPDSARGSNSSGATTRAQPLLSGPPAADPEPHTPNPPNASNASNAEEDVAPLGDDVLGLLAPRSVRPPVPSTKAPPLPSAKAPPLPSRPPLPGRATRPPAIPVHRSSRPPPKLPAPNAPAVSGMVNPFPQRRRGTTPPPPLPSHEPSREIFLPVAQRALAAVDAAAPSFREAMIILGVEAIGAEPRFTVELVATNVAGRLVAVDATHDLRESIARMLIADSGGGEPRFRRLVARLSPHERGASVDFTVS